MADAASTGAVQGGTAGASLGPWGALAGAVIGGIMGQQQKRAQDRARKEQALMNMYAPILKQEVKAIGVQPDIMLPSVVAGAGRGYEFGSGINWADLFKNDQNLVMPQTQGAKYGMGVDLPTKSILDDARYAPSLAGTGGPGLGLSSPMSVPSTANMFNTDPYGWKLGIGTPEPVVETAQYFTPSLTKPTH